jgi:small subunit ribosomal protein S20
VWPAVANIKQQKKRILVARRQRLENLRYRSAIKTYLRRLQAQIDAGDADAVAAEHVALVKLIDKAAAHRALHPNTAARKKARAARLVALGKAVEAPARKAKARPAGAKSGAKRGTSSRSSRAKAS